MQKTSRSGFVHSVKVPRIYKVASLIGKKVVEEGCSLKDLVYNSGHKNVKGIYALVVEAIKHSKKLDKLITDSKLLQKEVGLQPWLARILMTELLFGKKDLKGESKPVQTILSYKEQFEKLLANNKKKFSTSGVTVKKPRYVRVNTLHYTPDEIIKIFRKEGWIFFSTPSDYMKFLEAISNLENNTFTRDFHVKEVLVFPGNAQFYENDLYQNGSILLQDKASCLPAFLLKPQENAVVLDMCSAPGMKTTHLSAIMKNKGKIYAAEINAHRYKALCNIIQVAGCTNVLPIHTDALNLNLYHKSKDFSWVQDVEYILVDPSCSGSGIIERTKIFGYEKNDFRRLKKLCGFQFKLLKHALTSFPKVKRVVYSTCSVQPEENEMIVEDVLRNLKSLENNQSKVRFKLADPLESTWPRRGSDDHEVGRHCIFSDPEKDLTNGFFIAVFERLESSYDILSEPNIKNISHESNQIKGHKRSLEKNSYELDKINVANKKRKCNRIRSEL